ncbi:ankyrin repeat-containing domain protein [Cladorrhinum sp. PSN259]|nr:ankyrin repeat-containing domain protein [Cladorrhinum sp. PSN259]
MKTLLDWNLDPGETDNDGRTVLHLAARATDERFDILIDRMINVNQQDNTGQTALHILASMFKAPLERVDRLLQKGANVKICDHEGKTALHVAAGKNNWQLKRFLEFKGAINQPDKLGLTPFHYLLKDPYYYYNTGTDTCSVLESLLENGADIAAQDNEGRTSLHMAAKYGDRRLDQLLKMDLSKCINIRDGRGQTPLHALLTAPESPRLAENIRRLIENGQTLTHELATTKVF